MKNILFELYYGNLDPCEDTYPKEKEYRKAAKQVTSLEADLLLKLDDTGQELYQQLTYALIARRSIEDAYTFANGFRIGANIMLACMLQNDTSS